MTCDCKTMIEHFEKCVPGGKEALAKARAELGQPKARRKRKWSGEIGNYGGIDIPKEK